MRKEERNILDYFFLLKSHFLLSNSYMFVGDNFSLVKKILKLISCKNGDYGCNNCWDCLKIEEEKHPDVFFVEPQLNTIKIENIKEAQRFLYLKSFHLERKILIIKPGIWTAEATSCLLKTLEEPPKNSFIGICIFKSEDVFDTIVSRCRRIFLPLKEREARECSFDLVFNFLKGEKIKFKDRKQFNDFLCTLILIARDHLMKSLNLDKLLINKNDYEIINSLSIRRTVKFLKTLLEICKVSQNVNETLALNLIKMQL
jgi:DNA polymerase III gamma/tau subunit